MISAIFYGYPYFTKGYQEKSDKKLELRNTMSKDYFLMKSLLLEPFLNGDIDKTNNVIKNFFNSQPNEAVPYLGIILLNSERKVFNAYLTNTNIDVFKIIGIVSRELSGVAIETIETTAVRSNPQHTEEILKE